MTIAMGADPSNFFVTGASNAMQVRFNSTSAMSASYVHNTEFEERDIILDYTEALRIDKEVKRLEKYAIKNNLDMVEVMEAFFETKEIAIWERLFELEAKAKPILKKQKEEVEKNEILEDSIIKQMQKSINESKKEVSTKPPWEIRDFTKRTDFTGNDVDRTSLHYY